jgi:hypothetical protein
MTLKTQLEARLTGIGYKDGDYISFNRLYKILKSLRYVYLYNMDKKHSSLIGHEDKTTFPKNVRIISITELEHQIWSIDVGYIMTIEVGLRS